MHPPPCPTTNNIRKYFAYSLPTSWSAPTTAANSWVVLAPGQCIFPSHYLPPNDISAFSTPKLRKLLFTCHCDRQSRNNVCIAHTIAKSASVTEWCGSVGTALASPHCV